MSNLHIHNLHEYQNQTVNHIIRNWYSMLWLGLGLGKTIATLTAFNFLRQAGQSRAMLVVAPLRVCQLVWRQEAFKWSHVNHLTFSNMTGTAKKRERSLFRQADIYLINYESLTWLAMMLEHYFIKQGRPLPFDMIVWDEVSKVKRSASKRFAAFAPIVEHFQRRVGLTASPCSNGLQDLWGQFFMVDGGQRLGTNYPTFESAFFHNVSHSKYPKFEPYSDTRNMIVNRIADITVEMKASDHLDMPELTTIDIPVILPPKKMKMYKELEQNFFIELDNGTPLEVFNKAALSNKLLQYCIAEGTEVLTDSGWKPIESISKDDLLWDGIEWSSNDGLLDNGYKDTVQCWGVDMTPDHQVLTTHGWKQAQEILNGKPGNRSNRSNFQLPYSNEKRRIEASKRGQWEKCKSDLVVPMCMWKTSYSSESEFKEQDQKNEIVWLSSRASNYKREKFSRYDRSTSLDFMVQYAFALQQYSRQRFQKIWGTWNNCMRGMESRFQELLEGYGRHISSASYIGEEGQYQRLLQNQLQMGNNQETSKQSNEQCADHNTNGKNDCCSSSEKVQDFSRNNLQTYQLRMGRKRPVKSNRKKVYDISNVGERNRFTVRGDTGEIFIVHNCNGIVYNYPDPEDITNQEEEFIHDNKYEALHEIIEGSGDDPILLAYSYQSERRELMKRYPDAECLTGVKEHEAIDIMNRFNAGKIKLLIAHPMSAGHGLNLQEACSIVVWFGLNYNLELYEQFIGRIDRQGQKNPVRNFRIVCVDTMDYAVMDALAHKDQTQSAMRDAINRYRQ